MRRSFRALLPVAVALFASLAFAQTVKTLHFPREGSSRDRTVRVWLPKGYSRSHRYPVIFTTEVGDDALIAQVATYYTESLHRIPPVIVVGISAEVDDMGYSYETGRVNDAGKQFATFWSDTLIPFLDKKYPLAPFRAYFGHSYGASYADFLVREHPSWFQAYALLCPEQPEYRFDYAALTKALPRPTYLYLASAKGDIDRRQEHALDIAKQLAGTTAERIHFRHDVLPLADHLTGKPQAIPLALEFLFSGYKDYAYADTDGDLTRWFEGLRGRIQSLYGLEIQRDSLDAAYFTELAVERKDLRAMEAFEKYFVTREADASILFNTGQFYYQLGAFEEAERLYMAAIKRAMVTKQSDFLLMSYRTLALKLHSEKEQNAEKAWDILQKGMQATHDVAFEYYFGLISARHGYRIDDGIRYLTDFEKNRSHSFFGTLYSLDETDVLLAKCYLAKGDPASAKSYATKASNLNPANEEAQALLKRIP